MDGEIRLLLKLIDEAYSTKSWHGPNLRGSLRGLTARDAAWRPGRGRHSIREITLHAAYWKYAVRRRLLGEKRGSFSLKGSNWFVRPSSMSAKAWGADIALLESEHRALRQAVAGLDRSDLRTKPSGSMIASGHIIRGIAAHDLYHAGQIQLMKRLMRR